MSKKAIRRTTTEKPTVRSEFLKHVHSAGNNAYSPAPAAFPATLVYVESSDARQRCGRLIPDLEVHVVGGDHVTMLLPPHVDEVAPIVAEVARACFEPQAEHRSA